MSVRLAQHVRVDFRYDVHFVEGLFSPAQPLLADVVGEEGGDPKKVLAVADAGLLAHHPHLPDALARYAEAHAGALRLVAPPLVVPGGEAAKNDPALVDGLLAAVERHGLDRHSYVLAMGGGAVLDLVGYAAAVAHRGIRLVRVPTTVLAQNDSGIGVKNGINAFGKKNFLGTFAPPFAVLNDFSFLTTLDDRDWRAGISEAVKVALIKDAAFFEDLEADADALAAREMAPMQRLIVRCAQLHLDHIAHAGDPFEMGTSRPLDFGHWAAHKLEQLTRFELRHGEAVAIGMALDATYSRLAGFFPEDDWLRTLALLDRVGFRLHVPEMDTHRALLYRGLDEFREHLGGRLTIMLLRAIGEGLEVHEVDRARYDEAVDRLRAWSERRVAPGAMAS